METQQQQQQQQQAAAALKSRFKRVCVFCGSSPGKSPSYQLAAIQLGKQLVIHHPLQRLLYIFLPGIQAFLFSVFIIEFNKT